MPWSRTPRGLDQLNEMQERAYRELTRKWFSSAREKVRNCKTFANGASSVSTGEYVATMAPGNFNREIEGACVAMGISSTRGNRRPVPVQIALFEHELTVTAFDFSVFFRSSIRISDPVRGLTGGSGISFLLDDLGQLKRVCRASSLDETLKFVYDAGRGWLELKSNPASRLRLRTSPATDFSNQSCSMLGTPTHVQQIDPRALHLAVRYGGLFAERNLCQNFYNQIEVRPGISGSGTHTAIGLIQSAKLAFSLHIRHERIPVLAKLLDRFDVTDTHLFDTRNYHIIFDGTTCLGFEKFDFAFPGFLSALTRLSRLTRNFGNFAVRQRR
jgi:hypothetical protein